MHRHIRSCGIFLQETPYLGKKRILRVFTEETGLITLITNQTNLSPFCIGELIYQKKQSEIFTLIEGSLIDSLLGVRQSYEVLAAAGSMAQDLLRTQLFGKSAPLLYHLICSYFKKLPTFGNPTVLAMSFRLKLLLHEGLLALQAKCSRCNQEARFLIQGESACPEHAPLPTIECSTQEWHTLHCLVFARQFTLLQHLECPPLLREKIASLFEERINH